MNPAGRLAAFTLVLGVALGGGAAVGNAVGPIDVGSDEPPGHGGHGTTGTTDPAPATGGGANHPNEHVPGGVLVSQSGYTLEAERTLLDGRPGAPFRFRILGPDGAPVRDFEVAHQSELHLVVVGRDLVRYAHLHPTRGPDGTWSVALPALAPGAYRAFADFAVTGGPELTLGVDLTVPGNTGPHPPLPPRTTAAVDGYQVTLAGSPTAGTETELELTVARAGRPVTDIEPYLGAAGHLVAIRSADLAYLHVHPLDDVRQNRGPHVRFAVEVPSPGTYRLFFDFAHAGAVRTAALTVSVPAGAPHGDHGTSQEQS